LHAPPGEASGALGLVICKPFGYEAICAHRSMRVFADAAAFNGVPALRFDYLGTGDSADIEASADQMSVWVEDVLAAARMLRAETGVDRVCLLGLRLGALLATLAACRDPTVGALILIAPIVSGQRHLRELRAQRLAATLRNPHAAAAPCIEVGGYTYSSASLAALETMELIERVPPAIAAGALIIEAPATIPTQAWVQALISAGRHVDYRAIPGTVEMLMTDPQFAKVSQPMVAAFTAWLKPRLPPARAGGPGCRGDEGARRPSLTTGPKLTTRQWAERPTRIPSQVGCFAITTEPCAADRRRRGVVLLNSGAENHIGSSRIYVTLARRWARDGYTVLRLDLAGLGDSATLPGRTDDQVFPPDALDDVRAAVGLLRDRHGIDDVCLAGLCSGAYHALRGAIEGIPASRLLLINPMTYSWKQGMTADDMHRALEVARSLAYYRAQLFSESLWHKIRSGRLSPARIVRVLVYRPWLALEATLRDWARRINLRLPRDVAADLEILAARGVRLAFIFSRGEPGLDRLMLQCKPVLRRLGKRASIHVIDAGDHIFSRSEAREALISVATEELVSALPSRVEPAQETKRSQQCSTKLL
jgi:alpha-beta hydrolase superfamily lysophospholipase